RRHLRDRGAVGDDPGLHVQVSRETRVPHDADPPPLRDEGVVRDEDHGALLDRRRDPVRRRLRALLPLLLRSRMSAWAERVLEAAALRAGDTVLDVGAGSGALTLAAHERIGAGWVIAVYR